MPDGSLPWDLTPVIPNAVSDPVSVFSRIATALRPQENTRSIFPLALLLGIVIGALVSVWAWSRALGDSRSPRTKTRLALALSSTVVLLTLGTFDARPVNLDPRLTFYPVFPDFLRGWLRLKLGRERRARVAYAGTNIPYYLLGQGLKNDVRYVNVDGHRDWLLHDYHREALCARERDMAQFPARLGPDYPGVSSVGRQSRCPRDWRSWSSPA